MRSLELTPCAPLRPYVRLYWLLELDQPAAFGPPERISPDGLLELVFHYRTPFACRYDGESFAPQPRSVAVTQTRRFVEILPRGAGGLITVRFEPWGAYHFFRLPMAELADRQAPAELLFGGAAVELEERLAAAAGDVERVGLIEEFLLAQLRRHHKANVEPLVRAVWRRGGQASVVELCRELGVGERRLQRTFAAALGTTPKRYSSLTRFLFACQRMCDSNRGGLAEVALDCGYYDQSHFIAEFRSFSGMTPRQFAATKSLSFLALE